MADPDRVFDALINGVNRSLTSGPVASRDRKLIFSRDEADAFNQLPKMDAPFAAYFRVFWLELLLREENQQELLDAKVDLDSAKALLDRGRRFYLTAIIGKHSESHKATHDGWTAEECRSAARKSAVESLAKAYHKWFGSPKDEWRELLNTMLDEPASGEESQATVDDSEDSDAPIDPEPKA